MGLRRITAVLIVQHEARHEAERSVPADNGTDYNTFGIFACLWPEWEYHQGTAFDREHPYDIVKAIGPMDDGDCSARPGHVNAVTKP